MFTMLFSAMHIYSAATHSPLQRSTQRLRSLLLPGAVAREWPLAREKMVRHSPVCVLVGTDGYTCVESSMLCPGRQLLGKTAFLCSTPLRLPPSLARWPGTRCSHPQGSFLSKLPYAFQTSRDPVWAVPMALFAVSNSFVVSIHRSAASSGLL